MKIAVCVKQVPDTETRIRIAADGKGIVDSDVSWVVSPYDEFAIEEALRIKEAKVGEVVLLSLGPDGAVAALRNGLAMGADSALHLKDPLFEATDAFGAARALAAAKILEEPLRPADSRVARIDSHSGNFLDCLRTRRPAICHPETAVFTMNALIGGISLILRRNLKWDPAKAQFIGDVQANRLLSYTPRPPWSL